MPQSITLSSAGTITLISDFIGAKTTSVSVQFVSSTSSASITTPLEITLDSTGQGSTGVRWIRVSSATSAVLVSTTSFDAGLFQTFLTPIAGVRITSSSTSGGIRATLLQNAGG